MSEFITVSRDNKLFNDYMLGKVPENNQLQAIPVKGFNDSMFKEQVTFQIVEKVSINLKQWPLLLAQLFRLKWLTLTVTPVACSLAYMSSIGFTYNFFSVMLLFACLFCSHACIFILNDFYDHIFGVDSLSTGGGTRVIQKAWLTAKQIKFIGLFFLSQSCILGFILAYNFGFKLIVFGSIGLLMSWVYSYLSKFKRFLGLNGFIINMFMGPFLVLAVTWGLSGYVNLSLLFIGLFFGLLAYICISYRHLENLYFSKKNYGTSIVEILGFDKAKIFLLMLVVLMPFVYLTAVFSFLDSSKSLKNLLLCLPAVFYGYLLVKNFSLKTSMGSLITHLRDVTASLHCISGLTFIIYFLA